MEEQELITIRVYDAVNDIYYDKQVPYEPPVEKPIEISQDEINLELDYRITMLELGL